MNDPQHTPPPEPTPPEPTPPAQPGPDPRDAELADLRAKVEQLAAQRQEHPGLGAGPAAPPSAAAVPEPPDEMPDYAGEWPQLGGLKGADGEAAPQPWDLRAFGLVVGTGNDGTTTVTSPHRNQSAVIAAGEPNTVSSIVVAHGRPILGPLSSDPAVAELGSLLAQLGYPTSVSRGENPQNVVDTSVLDAVERFRTDYGVEEDPSQWPIDSDKQVRVHVGPWTWEALLRAAKLRREETGEDSRMIVHPRA